MAETDLIFFTVLKETFIDSEWSMKIALPKSLRQDSTLGDLLHLQDITHKSFLLLKFGCNQLSFHIAYFMNVVKDLRAVVDAEASP